MDEVLGHPTSVQELDIEETYTDDENNEHKTGLEGTTLYLFFKDAFGIRAGIPYLVKWDGTKQAKDTEGIEWVDPMFCGVNICSVPPASVTSEDGAVSFVSCYSPVTLIENDRTKLFLGADNQLYWPSVDVTIYAFRAYFELAAGSKVHSFRMNLGGNGGEATGILSTENGQLGIENDSWYSVDGRKLLNAPKRKGLYIHNGVKVTIK